MDPNTTISGPSKRYFAGMPITAQYGILSGLVALWFFKESGPVLLSNPIYL